jgi:predicted ATP-grasp superfamily ATP-dependent carboligase
MKNNTNIIGALVITDSYTGLGIIRSLGRKGVPVWVVGGKFSVAGASRYTQHITEFGASDESQKINFLVELAKQNNLKNWVLFPDSDKNAGLIARNYNALAEYYLLTVPAWNTLEWAFNKRQTYELANRVGIPFPKTFYPASRSEVEAITGNFPMILKPAHHQGEDLFSIGRAWKADNQAELLDLYDRAAKFADPSVIMIQEMIPGGSSTQLSFACICKNGKILASAVAERKRLLPADFGVGAYIETIDKPELKPLAQKWLEKINYTGLAEIDFKFDERENNYKILDVNARPWGWLAMCPKAGVDFAFLMWQLAQGIEITSAEARPGVRWIRTPYDFMAALQGLASGSLSLKEYFASLKNADHEMYAADDLLPVIAEIPLLAKLVWNKINNT